MDEGLAMSDALVVQAFPFGVDVEEGKTYKWCACGRSKSQPFCDDSHTGTGIEPQTYTATVSRRVQFCGCKKSRKGAICDGTHNRL
jgi:CDGSH-type Zn-finger protein